MLGIVSHGLNGKLKGYEIAEDCAKQCKSPHPFPLLYDFSYYPYPLINMSMIHSLGEAIRLEPVFKQIETFLKIG